MIVMARTSKTTAQKEKELLQTIADAKKKLHKIQQIQRLELGEIACKHGLHNFELSILDKEFKELALKLNQR